MSFSFLEAVRPVVLAVTFVCDGAFEGTLSISAHPTQTEISILQQLSSGNVLTVPALDATAALSVEDGEAIVIVARRLGAIVASGVFEVDCSLGLADGALLVPRSAHNLLLTQERREEPATGTTQPLEAEAVQGC